MSKWNYRERNRRATIAWQAVALAILLLPVTAPLARGQFSVTVSIMLNSQVSADELNQEGPASSVAPEKPRAAEAPTAPVPPEAPVQAVEPQSASVDATPLAPTDNAAVVTVQDIAPQPTTNDQTSSSSLQPKETQLSVEPGATLLRADRPAWISNEIDLKSATHRFVVSSFPTARESEIDSNLDLCLEEAARSYANQLLNDEQAGDMLAAHLSSAFVRTNLLDDRTSYLAELSTTGGAMFQKWVMVEVTKEQQEQIRTWYHEQIQRKRLIPLAVGLTGFVVLIGAGNLLFRRSAGKSQQSSMMKVVGKSPAATCCGKRGGWGYAFAIVIAIVVAALVKAG